MLYHTAAVLILTISTCHPWELYSLFVCSFVHTRSIMQNTYIQYILLPPSGRLWSGDRQGSLASFQRVSPLANSAPSGCDNLSPSFAPYSSDSSYITRNEDERLSIRAMPDLPQLSDTLLGRSMSLKCLSACVCIRYVWPVVYMNEHRHSCNRLI